MWSTPALSHPKTNRLSIPSRIRRLNIWYSASVAIRCWMVFTWLLIASVGEFVSPSIDSCSRTPSFPTPRVPPFLGSPAFYRYYVGAKTPFPPALARTYLAAQSRGVGLVFIGPVCRRLAGRGRGRCFPVSPWSGCCPLVWYGSPVFHGLPLDGLPCSSTPPAPSDLA